MQGIFSYISSIFKMGSGASTHDGKMILDGAVSNKSVDLVSDVSRVEVSVMH